MMVTRPILIVAANQHPFILQVNILNRLTKHIYNFERRPGIISGWPPFMAVSLWPFSSVASYGGMSIAGEQLKNPCGCSDQTTSQLIHALK
jgi:hypothetical protein